MMYWPTVALPMAMAMKKVMAMVTAMATAMVTDTVAMAKVVTMPKVKRKKD